MDVRARARARLNREGIMLGSQALARFVIIRENPINSTGRLNKRKNTVRWGARPRLFSSLSRDRQKIFAKKRMRNIHIDIRARARAHTLSHLNWISLSFFSRLRYRLRSLNLSESRWREDSYYGSISWIVTYVYTTMTGPGYPIRFSIRRSFA